jgi:ABC-2 type transport system permease protein
VHGLETFLSIMVLSFIALILFMGFGFIVSSVAKNESTIPPFANLITLPQFLLGGTFFSVEAFPSWLQPVCRILPLTHFNNAMSKYRFRRSEPGELLERDRYTRDLGGCGIRSCLQNF